MLRHGIAWTRALPESGFSIQLYCFMLRCSSFLAYDGEVGFLLFQEENYSELLMRSRIGKQAVVVGAGMAGLTAARSLADFFERVIVLENARPPKDLRPWVCEFPSRVEARRRTSISLSYRC